METVLVRLIEDDPAVQVILDEALCEGGYEPALAASGEEAVTLLKGRKLPYRVLVTDINLLGRIDGWGAPNRRESWTQISPWST